MPDFSDLSLLKTDEPPRHDRRVSPGVWIAVGVLVFAVGIALYVVYGRRPAPAPPPAAAKAVEPPPPTPLGGDAERIALPPLAETDPIVRDLVRKVTSHPTALAWLATDGLIRNFTVVVSNIADGATPAQHLRAVRPSSPFRVVERDDDVIIDARSYTRYDGIAAAAASIDPAVGARLYATLKPRIEEAYSQLGVQAASFDRALERAIVVLLQTPVVDGPVRVEPKGIGWRYADAKIENLTAAQKQLLRTGPRNVRMIQGALRQLALALGIPSERLP